MYLQINNWYLLMLISGELKLLVNNEVDMLHFGKMKSV